jgi:hypothetical protein
MQPQDQAAAYISMHDRQPYTVKLSNHSMKEDGILQVQPVTLRFVQG